MQRVQICDAIVKCPPPCSRDRLLVLFHDVKPGPSTVVVMVHGLFGSRSGENGTWQGMLGALAQLVPQVDLALYEYRTGFARWGVWAPISVETDARVLTAHLNQLATQYESIILMAHSLGGLVTMEALNYLHALHSKSVLRRIVGFFALAVPFLGSTRVPWITQLVSADARALSVHSQTVTRLNEQFSLAFRTKLDSKLRQFNHVPGFALVGAYDPWVSVISARGSFPPTQSEFFAKDHHSICQPTDAQDPVVLEIAAKLRDINRLLLQPAVRATSGSYLIRLATELDRDPIIELGNQAFGTQSVGDEYFVPWLRKNPTTIYVLQDRDNGGAVGGYWCVLPVTEQSYRDLISGELKPADLDASKVLSLEEECGFYYVGGVVAIGTKMRARAILGFEEFIRRKADIHARRAKGPIWVLARAATRDGLKMITRNAFEHVNGSSGLGGLYQRSFFGRAESQRSEAEPPSTV